MQADRGTEAAAPQPLGTPRGCSLPSCRQHPTLSAGLEAISVLCVSFDTPCKSRSLGPDSLCRDTNWWWGHPPNHPTACEVWAGTPTVPRAGTPPSAPVFLPHAASSGTRSYTGAWSSSLPALHPHGSSETRSSPH